MIPSFLADRFDVKALEADASTLVALDPGATILWVNPAWERFARANDGAQVLVRFCPSASYFDGISPPLRAFYEQGLGGALSTDNVFQHDYECSSPDAFRLFHMRALPIASKGLLVEHSLVVDRPHDRPEAPALEELYRDANGLVVMCSNCRRVRRAHSAGWDWVPAWVRKLPPRTSHGICDACVGFYFP